LILKLFGTPGQCFEGYRRQDGLNVEVPDGARVKDRLVHLGLSELKGCVVAAGGRIAKPTGLPENNMTVHVLPSGAGG
jgi:hypothetical protein